MRPPCASVSGAGGPGRGLARGGGGRSRGQGDGLRLARPQPSTGASGQEISIGPALPKVSWSVRCASGVVDSSEKNFRGGPCQPFVNHHDMNIYRIKKEQTRFGGCMAVDKPPSVPPGGSVVSTRSSFQPGAAMARRIRRWPRRARDLHPCAGTAELGPLGSASADRLRSGVREGRALSGPGPAITPNGSPLRMALRQRRIEGAALNHPDRGGAGDGRRVPAPDLAHGSRLAYIQK